MSAELAGSQASPPGLELRARRHLLPLQRSSEDRSPPWLYPPPQLISPFHASSIPSHLVTGRMKQTDSGRRSGPSSGPSLHLS